jgi:hypothetical protein
VLAGLPANAGSYTVEASYAGDANHSPSAASAAIVIQKATADVAVSGYAGTYDGQPHRLTGRARGVNGEDLSGLLDLGDGRTDAGSYTTSWAFLGTDNYDPTAGTAVIRIDRAAPTVRIVGGAFVYNEAGHPATGSVAGAGNVSLGTPTFTYKDDEGSSVAVPVEPGYYTATATFAGNANYLPATATATITVAFEARTLTDLSKAFAAGRTIPIKLQLTDAAGHNLSSSDVDVAALKLERVNADGTRSVVSLQDAGGANPGNLFRYDAGLQGYIFNLSTKGLSAGQYAFSWMAEDDPTVHELSFRLA